MNKAKDAKIGFRFAGREKTTNDVIKFSYHFYYLDAQPDFSGTFHHDFSHIAPAR